MTKRQIRIGMFETNSSSVHTITISKKYPKSRIPKKLHFGFGEYEWGVERLESPEGKANYLYTAICTLDGVGVENKRIEYTEKVRQWLKEAGVNPTFEDFKEEGGWYENGYIDHSGELGDFINFVMASKENMLRYLFGDGSVYVYNDNMDIDEEMQYIDDLNKDKDKRYDILIKVN